MKKVIKEVFFILLLSGLISGAVFSFHPLAPPLYRVQNPEEEKWALSFEETQKLGDKILWIDARDKPAYFEGHVPGALSLTPEEWDSTSLDSEIREQIFSLSHPAVIYCGGETCQTSKKFAEMLRELISPVTGAPFYFLKGGWKEWKGEVEK